MMSPNKIRPDGAIVHWDSKPVVREVLRRVLDDHGLFDLMPNETGDGAALKAAMTAGKGKDQLVTRTKKAKKYELANVERGETHNYYVSDFTAVVEDGQVATDYGYVNREQLQAHFNEAKARVSSTKLSELLKNVVKRFGGHQTGADHWIPETGMDAWQDFARSVKDRLDIEMAYYAVILDEETMRTIAEGIAARIRKDAETMMREISSEKLGAKAIESRKADIAELRQAIQQHSEILGELQQGLVDTLALADQAATLATLLAVTV